MAHIKKNILVHTPVDKVYEFARDPNNWNAWWVGLHEPDQITGKGEKGTVVNHKFTMAGFTFPLLTRVLEDKPGPKEANWKGEFEGGINGKQEWTYTAKGNDTEVTCDIDYTVPGKVLGKFADRLIIEKLQENAMELSLQNLKIFCESKVAAPVHA